MFPSILTKLLLIAFAVVTIYVGISANRVHTLREEVKALQAERREIETRFKQQETFRHDEATKIENSIDSMSDDDVYKRLCDRGEVTEGCK